jgi:questin oxidase-like protein
MPWIERYRPRLLPRGPAGEPVAADRWREALGKRGSFVAWRAFFAVELGTARWRQVLDRWAARLAPGFSGAATHGAIRVGHAARALRVGETPARQRELADALASWAASYRELPKASSPLQDALPPRQAIARVPLLPPERRRPGNITEALAGLDDFPEFAPTIDLVDLGGEVDALLAQLTELFARVYLANVHNVPSAIVFIHGVTSLAALGHIAPHVEDATARSLLRYGWQAGCGLYACFGRIGIARETAAGEEDGDGLIERALANGDEHVIKFTEACLSRHMLAPSPAYPAAAAHACGVIAGR